MENIPLCGKPCSRAEEVLRAARAIIRMILLYDWDDYDTDIGQRGQISEEQKRELSIAEVFLKNPPIPDL